MLRVVLIETEGRGGRAEVEIGGHRLAVVDAFSPVGEPAGAGPVSAPRLEAVAIPHLSGRPPAGPDHEKGLVAERGWRYRGCGEIVSTQPLRVDLGPFSLELGLPMDGDLAIGEFLIVAIDRIILSSDAVRKR